MILYHVTPSANVHSIMTEGIIPAYKKGLSSNYVIESEKWRYDTVWLTDDPMYIINNQASWCWVSEEEPVILEIDCSNLEIEHRDYCYDGHEWLYYGVISPELVKDQKLVDINEVM